LMLGVSQIFLSTKQVYANQGAVSRIQENGRLAMEFLSRDIRMAGYTGCATRAPDSTDSTVTNAISTLTVLNRVQDGIEGVDGVSTVPTGYGITRVNGTDVLVIRGALNGGSSLSAANAASSISMNTTSESVETGACSGSTARVNGICGGDIVVVADCAKATVLSAASVSTGGAISLEQTLAAGAFGTDAEVMVANTVAYYIGTNPVGRRALYQRVGSNTPAELLEGVRDMQLTYGRDTDADGIPNTYQTAAEIAAISPATNGWPRVSSVRIQLLAESIEDNVTAEPQPYTFNGVAVGNPGDNRLRQVFVSTVAIRGRLP